MPHAEMISFSAAKTLSHCAASLDLVIRSADGSGTYHPAFVVEIGSSTQEPRLCKDRRGFPAAASREWSLFPASLPSRGEHQSLLVFVPSTPRKALLHCARPPRRLLVSLYRHLHATRLVRPDPRSQRTVRCWSAQCCWPRCVIGAAPPRLALKFSAIRPT